VTRAPQGSLYRLDARGCSAMAAGIRIPNSLSWSPDGRYMYFADSLTRMIHRYAFDPASGELGERKLFCTIEPPAIPDGATVDAEGCVWCALYDGWRIACIAPEGRMARSIELPVQRPTSVQFAGPNLDVLLVTTATQRLSAEELAAQPLAGALLAVDAGVKGVPEARYAG
jgi:sugar lactone lactonase YvrE